MTTYFTSDTHFGHVKILEYCSRPFKDVEEMNDALCERWNSRVQPGDTVYHLGDFSMGPRQNIFIRKRLNGRVILIKGNHDRTTEQMLGAGFDEVHKKLTIEIEGKKVYLAHIPVHLPDQLDDRKHSPTLMQTPPEDYDFFLCGHVHLSWKRIGNTINVGTDVSNFYPLTFQELLKRDLK